MPDNEDRKAIVGKDRDGNNVTIDVLRPTATHLRTAQMEYNRAFRDALESGALLRQKLDQYMTDQGLWDESKEKKYQEINKQILDLEKKLRGGGIKLKTAKKLALTMREKRDEFRDLISERTAMDGNTAEGQADNARFNSLLIQCLVEEETEDPLFDSLESYDKKATEPYVIAGAGQLAQMMYNLDPEYDNNLPENKFLRDYKFADKENRLINNDGKLVDDNGKLINEEGRYVDENGEYVDVDGNRLDKDGEYIIDEKPFLDDDGQPVVLESDQDEETEEDATSEEITASKEVEAQ
jgi:hypothetical protein